MNRSNFTPAIFFCASTLAFAETQITLSPSLLYFDYTEFSTTNIVLNRETGWLPGLESKLGYRLSADWFLAAHAAYYDGTVDYAGQTQSGASHNTDTKTRLLRMGARIEKLFHEKSHIFISAQSHRWLRNILNNNDVSGITETYRWMEYSIGLNTDLPINDKNTLALEAGFLVTRNANIDVDLSRIDAGSATLDIGNGTGARVSLAWNRQYEVNIRYAAGIFFEAWEFGRSNTKQTSGGSSSVFITEPGSETRNTGIKLNIEYSF